MRKAFYGVGVVAVASTAGISVSAFQHEVTIQDNVYVGSTSVGGLTPEEAAKQVRIWWESEKLKTLKIQSDKIKKPLPEFKPNDLGVTIDDLASVEQLPLKGVFEDVKNAVTGEPEQQKFKPVYKNNGLPLTKISNAVRAAYGPNKPARAVLQKGAIVRTPEVSGMALDSEALEPSVIAALENDGIVQLPLTEAPKKVSDEELKKIKEVVTEFSTTFSAGNRPRSKNIRLAASKIDGLVLAPGEQFSFNGTVGQRTAKAGYQVAGVFINGRHDTGLGGGICQVSTTLYNAALLSNMKIVTRRNHSLPVPYVPVGRDATVNWGTQDMVLENNFGQPIAISCTYAPGKLTFRILGQKQPGLSVKIERDKLRSWKPSTKTVYDSSLAAGRRKVIESGSTGYSVYTYRLVFENGKQVKREELGRSHYPGGTTIVAIGTAKARRAPSSPKSQPAAPAEPAFEPVEDGSSFPDM